VAVSLEAGDSAEGSSDGKSIGSTFIPEIGFLVGDLKAIQTSTLSAGLETPLDGFLDFGYLFLLVKFLQLPEIMLSLVLTMTSHKYLFPNANGTTGTCLPSVGKA